jgi:uncharacterized protein
MITMSAAEARTRMIAHLGLARPMGRGRRGAQTLLERLRCIQLDPLDVIGTNADLVVMARVDGIQRGELWRWLFPRASHTGRRTSARTNLAFEHFAKERCILPADAFPWYRVQGHKAQAPWWRHGEREQRVPKKLIAAVLAEVGERGPVSARELRDHGSVDPIDWSGWKGTAKATSMALEILWTSCDIVVAGRAGDGSKLYDIPQQSLGLGALAVPAGDFGRWAIRERAQAAGLLSRSGGSTWSMLSDVRTSGVPHEMIESGDLVEVMLEGSSRRYLAVPSFLDRPRVRYDDRVRILGPLDPLLWDRTLVHQIFDFEYVWEVYKPAHLRKWGWYVCPLLHRDRLIGRVDARIERNALVVRRLWVESAIDPALIRTALEQHAAACGCSVVRMPKKSVVMRA